MDVIISTQTIKPMIEICKKHKQGFQIKNELENLLNHEDYAVELERY